MAKVIKCDLSVDSLENAITELEEYRKSITDKLDAFITALLSVGISEAKSRLASTIGDSTSASIGSSIPVKTGNKIVATIFLIGKDALFIEFGAGIYYNNGNAHPDAAQFGYGVGTYPSKNPPNKAINPGYWYWYEDTGNGKVAHLSLGTKASMPIFFASETMRNQAIQKAIEVFRS